MAKILMTGMTPNACDIQRKRNPLYSGASAVLNALKFSGHEVTNMRPDRVQNLQQYDRIVFELYAPASMASGYGAVGFKLLVDARRNHIPVTFNISDWHLNLIGSGLKSFSMHSHQLLRHSKLMCKNVDTYNMIVEYVDAIMSTMSEIRDGFFGGEQIKCFLPWFNWVENDGPENAIRWPSSRFIRYDPTNLFDEIDDLPYMTLKRKTRAWVLSSRYDFTRVIEDMRAHGSKWPVIRFGCKKCGDRIVPNELDLLPEAYAPNWGIISHPYPEYLQGQWRNRFMFAIRTGSIIAAFGKERIDKWFTEPTQIESLSDTGLENVADMQAQSYMDSTTPRHEAVKRINDVVTR